MTSQSQKDPLVSRRGFLSVTWAVALLALFAQAGHALFKFLRPRVEPGAFGGQVIAGRVAEFAAGSVNHVQKGRFYISHTEDGGLLALWHRCTHLGCTVPWNEEQGVFLCPCHSSAFSTTGEVLGGPAPRPMDLFPIKIVDEQVVVDTSTPIERSKYDPGQGIKV
ncbi:MAG: Rieske (2Fe-2S) protein [Chloroflexi bacterium]|nr:MAG: Rieske (2Fe-2S) protein [Chloroflexota bacterium]MBL1197480.1 Rieske (2Fe-2S) protein [Chloroflexota bacterium]NOH14775.1 Rieske 2Fe-2S domain-containing protein [Chloroflexota bacterium]